MLRYGSMCFFAFFDLFITKFIIFTLYIRMLLAILTSLTVIVLNATDVVDLLIAALAGTFVLIITNCLNISFCFFNFIFISFENSVNILFDFWIPIKQVYAAVNIPLIVTFAGSFAMANAVKKTGVAAEISDNLSSIFEVLSVPHPHFLLTLRPVESLPLVQPWGKVGLLFGIYLCTALLSAILSNSASGKWLY